MYEIGLYLGSHLRRVLMPSPEHAFDDYAPRNKTKQEHAYVALLGGFYQDHTRSKICCIISMAAREKVPKSTRLVFYCPTKSFYNSGHRTLNHSKQESFNCSPKSILRALRAVEPRSFQHSGLFRCRQKLHASLKRFSLMHCSNAVISYKNIQQLHVEIFFV